MGTVDLALFASDVVQLPVWAVTFIASLAVGGVSTGVGFAMGYATLRAQLDAARTRIGELEKKFDDRLNRIDGQLSKLDKQLAVLHERTKSSE